VGVRRSKTNSQYEDEETKTFSPRTLRSKDALLLFPIISGEKIAAEPRRFQSTAVGVHSPRSGRVAEQKKRGEDQILASPQLKVN
jgi:hypothetical protein